MENPACLRFILGVLSIAGIPYEVVQGKYSISRSYYYSLRPSAERVLEVLFRDGEPPKRIIVVTKHFIERCVLCLSLHCRAPIESIVAFFSLVIGISVSKGNIGRIRTGAAEKAREFDAGISLIGIQEIAIDEIFQHGKPVLTGIDLDTHYVFLMEGAEERSGECWAKKLQESQKRGLEAGLNVSDGGSGLLKGVQQVFPGVRQQPDVFHLLRNLGREVRSIDRYGMAKLRAYYQIEERLKRWKRRHTGCPPLTLAKQHWELAEELDGILAQVDTVEILFDWLREYVGFTECGYRKSLELCRWILDEMAGRFPEREKYQKEINRLRAHLPELLSFLQRMWDKIQQKTVDFPYANVQDFQLLYQQKYQKPGTQAYEWAERRLYRRFGRQLPDAREALDETIRSTHRASSMIENVNGRLRCFMDLKRDVPNGFLILIKVFVNTKKPARNRNKSWNGTSAVERLTHDKYPEFLDIVSAPMDYAF